MRREPRSAPRRTVPLPSRCAHDKRRCGGRSTTPTHRSPPNHRPVEPGEDRLRVEAEGDCDSSDRPELGPIGRGDRLGRAQGSISVSGTVDQALPLETSQGAGQGLGMGAETSTQAAERHAAVHLLERDEHPVVQPRVRRRVDVGIGTGHIPRTRPEDLERRSPRRNQVTLSALYDPGNGVTGLAVTRSISPAGQYAVGSPRAPGRRKPT